MDMKKVIREIGFFEVGINLVNVIESDEVKIKAGAIMPLPDRCLVDNVVKIAEWLVAFGKSKYMFFTPEIAIIEKIATINDQGTSIILMPSDMELEVKERLKNNLPHGMIVTLLEEPYFPEKFFPRNGILIVCGYMADERMMVLPETYRMIEHYNGFFGKKVFIPYTKLIDATRYKEWIEVSANKFNAVWRAT